jgi:hypothetical protein
MIRKTTLSIVNRDFPEGPWLQPNNSSAVPKNS